MQHIANILRITSNPNALVQRISSVVGTITIDEWNQCLGELIPRIEADDNFYTLCKRIKGAKLTLQEGNLEEVFCRYLRNHYFKKWVAEYDDFPCSLNSDGLIDLSEEEQRYLFEFFTDKPEHVSNFIECNVGREPLMINGESIEINPMYGLYKDAWDSVKAQDNGNVLFVKLHSLVSGTDIKYEKFIRCILPYAHDCEGSGNDYRLSELSAEEGLSLFEFFAVRSEHVSGFIENCKGREPLVVNGESIAVNPLYKLYEDAWGSVQAQENSEELFSALYSLISSVDMKYEKFIRYIFLHAQYYNDLSEENRKLLFKAYQKLQYCDITGYLELPEDIRRSEWLAELFVTKAKEAEVIFGYVARYMAKQFPQCIESQPWYRRLWPSGVAPTSNRVEKDYYLYGLLPRAKFDALLASVTDKRDLTEGDGYYLTAPATEDNPEGRGERLYATTVFHYIFSAPLAEKEKDYRIAEILSKYPALRDVMLKKVKLNRCEGNGWRAIQNNVYDIDVEIDDEYNVLMPAFTSRYARLYSAKHDATMTNSEKFVIGLMSGDLSFLSETNYLDDYLLDRYFMDLISSHKSRLVPIYAEVCWFHFTHLMQEFANPDDVEGSALLEKRSALHFGLRFIMQQEVTKHNSKLFDLYFEAIVRHYRDARFESSRHIVMLFSKLRPTTHVSDIGSIDSYQDYVWAYDPADWEIFRSQAGMSGGPSISNDKESAISEYLLSLVTSFASFALALISWAAFGSVYMLSVISAAVLSFVGLLSAYEAVNPGVLPEVINPGRNIPRWFGFSRNHEDANLMEKQASL